MSGGCIALHGARVKTLRALSALQQLSQERIGSGFPSQEINETVHLLATSARLKNLLSVQFSLGGIHGILGEDRVEHVRRERLRVEVAI